MSENFISQLPKRVGKRFAHYLHRIAWHLDGSIHAPYTIQPIEEVFEKKYGHKKSFLAKNAIDAEGKPIPWFSYPAVEYLKSLDLSSYSVFEWGGGNSSLFFAGMSKEVVTVESDPDWFKIINGNRGENQRLFLVDLENYVEYPKSLNQKFELVLIDGKKRAECARVGVQLVAERGFIILDNSDWYPDTCAFIRSNGFEQIDFCGFGPIATFTTTTSFFIKRPFLSFPKKTPIRPLGGINNLCD